jgi:hypothetical protein
MFKQFIFGPNISKKPLFMVNFCNTCTDNIKILIAILIILIINIAIKLIVIYYQHRKARKAFKPNLTVNTNVIKPMNSNDIRESTLINTPNVSAIENHKHTHFNPNLSGLTPTLAPHNVVNVNQYDDSFRQTFTPIFDS